jgi:glutamine amidotransferase
MIGIVNYGMGNLRSVEKAFEAVGARVVLSSDEAELAECHALVLPGVGAFGDGMAGLRARGLDRFVVRRVGDGVPLIGLCLGLQLLFEESEEFGAHTGLGLLRGRVVRFPESVRVIPHTGWNAVRPTREAPLFEGIADESYFYFVHSFYVEPADPEDALATTEYRGVVFPSVCGRGAVYGAQFHPEKSHHAGLRMLGNFAKALDR